MNFEYLWIKAFRGLKTPTTIKLGDRGLVLVEGVNRDWGNLASSNGAGKSLYFREAILWCLSGKFSRFGDSTPADAPNHKTRGAEVEMGVDECRIIRSRGSKGGPAIAVRAPDGSAVPLSRDTNVKADDVARLLGFDFVGLTSAVVMGSDTTLADAGFAAQMQAIESVLHLNELSEAQEAASKDRIGPEREWVALTRELELRKQAKDAAERALKEEDQPERLVNLQSNVTAITRRIETTVKILEEIPAIYVEVAQARKQYQTCEVAYEPVDQQLRRVKQVVETLERAVGVCPTCQRPLKTKAEANKIKLKLKKAKAEVAKYQKLEERLGEALDKASDVLERAEDHVPVVNQALPMLAAHQGSLQFAHQLLDEYEQRVFKARQDFEQAAKVCTETEEQQKAAASKVARVAFWAASTGFGRDGLMAHLFAQGMPILNEAANYYSSRLTGGLIQVEFTPYRETNREDMVRVVVDGQTKKFKACSKGEKERVNLITGFALRSLARKRLGAPISLSVFDESFDGIDDLGLEAIAALLQEEIAQGGTTIVITHSPTLKRYFPSASLIRVVRQDGEATIEQ